MYIHKQKDEQFYRGRVLEWNEEKGECLVLFIDFGNREWCQIDATTRMSDSLRQVKPMAINCRLREPIKTDSAAYDQLNELINSEILFDVRVKKLDLERVLNLVDMETYGEFKCECELITTAQAGADGGGVFVSPATLIMPSLWENIVEQQRVHVEKCASETNAAGGVAAESTNDNDIFVMNVIRNIKNETSYDEVDDEASIPLSQRTINGTSSTCSQQANNNVFA